MLRASLLGAALGLAAVVGAHAQGSTAPAQTQPQRINVTGHPISLTLPATLDSIYLGDIGVTIQPDDTLQFSPDRAIALLSNILIQSALDNLKAKLAGKPVVSPADFTSTSISVRYDPKKLQLAFNVPMELRAAQIVPVATLGQEVIGKFVEPANFSAYMNIRGNLDYVENGANPGLHDPVFYLDGALWSHGIALESEGIAQPGSFSGADFQRQGTRLVYDDRDNLIRWTAGDLQPVGQGFQSSSDMAGLSLFRSYSVLSPLRSVRPSGAQSFQLRRPSDVTITVNGTNVRRVHLDPGTYNLQDFPFTQGANDVTVSIVDDTGAQETLRFNVFLNQTQLAPGLSEFGLFAGVKSPLGRTGPHYTDKFEVSGYYRRGLSQGLTVGVNFQADSDTQMGGWQMLLGTNIGTFGLDTAASHVRGYGGGYAATLTFQRLFQFVGGQGDSLNLSATLRSENFAPVGITVPDNRYSYEMSGAYSHAFNEKLYGSVSAHYGHGRNGYEDIHDYHGVIGYRLSQDIGLTLDTSYQQGGLNHGFGALITLTWQASNTSSVRADYNTRQSDGRLSYYNVSGTGVGAYNITADVERADYGSSFNGTVNYISNRADLGLSHFSSFDSGFGNVSSQTTSARISTSIAYADGAVSIGRPIAQTFAIVEPHESLDGTNVIVQPTPYNYAAETGDLGTATDSQMSAYVPSTITVSAPNAPPGYDLGTGSFRVNPPYRAGYKLVVGSAYSVTAIGRLLQSDGTPVSLIAGQAIELDNPKRPPVTVFTNRQGRFGLAGLKPGKWRIEMPTEPETDYVLDVPEGTKGVLRVGDLKPSGSRE